MLDDMRPGWQNERSDCQHYRACLDDAIKADLESVCPADCKRYAPQTLEQRLDSIGAGRCHSSMAMAANVESLGDEAPSARRRLPRDPRDYVGKRFGTLTVIGQAGWAKVSVAPGRPQCEQALWRFRCDCGRETVRADNTVLRWLTGKQNPDNARCDACRRQAA